MLHLAPDSMECSAYDILGVAAAQIGSGSGACTSPRRRRHPSTATVRWPESLHYMSDYRIYHSVSLGTQDKAQGEGVELTLGREGGRSWAGMAAELAIEGPAADNSEGPMASGESEDLELLGTLDYTTEQLSLAGLEKEIEACGDSEVLRAILEQGPRRRRRKPPALLLPPPSPSRLSLPCLCAI